MKQYNKIKSTVKLYICIFIYIFSIYYIWNDFLLDVIFVYYAELILTHFNEFRFSQIPPFINAKASYLHVSRFVLTFALKNFETTSSCWCKMFLVLRNISEHIS